MSEYADIKDQLEEIQAMLGGDGKMDEIRKERRWHVHQRNCRCALICLTVVLCTLIGCCTYFTVLVYQEQQYALNMQYSGLLDYVNGATITETGENGVIIEGDDNAASSQGDVEYGEESQR